MRHYFVCLVLVCLATTSSLTAQTKATNASTTSATSAASAVAGTQVPRLVKFSGAVQGVNSDASGVAAVAGDSASSGATVVGMAFSLYSEQAGGVPLWSEVQNVVVDKTGHYTVELGATKPDGLAVELFTSAQAQWLGIRQEGQAEQPRIMLMSVPYALKAADAETFGGKPPSAYAAAPDSTGTSSAGTTGQTANGKQTSTPPIGGGGTANYIALWTSGSNLGTSSIYQASTGDIGIGTTTPTYPLSVHVDTSHPALYVLQAGSTGTGIVGNATHTTGANRGVWGLSASSGGVGVYGTNSSTTGTGVGVQGQNESDAGVAVAGAETSATGNTYGVYGTVTSTTGTGVFGESTSTSGLTRGVYGTTDSTAGVGVVGSASATTGAAMGVKGTTDSAVGVGVYGVGTSDSGQNYGVEGTTQSPNSVSVVGKNISDSGPAVGVYGLTNSTGGTGSFGVGVDLSDTSTTVNTFPIGAWGDTNQQGGIGVLGTADDTRAVVGFNNADNIATAEFENDESTDFSGPVLVAHGTHYAGTCLMDVSGNLDCTGSKSAVVPVDDGTRKVALYAVEAPENWFEDAGSGQLANGAAVISLEPTFVQTVNTDVEYHVFLTPDGDCKGLYVTNKAADSFEVRELGGGTANIAFDYRIMARRKGYETIRLADQTKRFDQIANQSRIPPGKVAAPKTPRVPTVVTPADSTHNQK